MTIISRIDRLPSLLVMAALLAVLLSPVVAHAQGTAPGWTESEAINTECCATWPVPVTDNAGGLHLFWADTSGAVMYSRWQDDKWSTPVDIVSSGGRAIQTLDATYSDDGFLHVVWGAGGPLLYSKAWVDDAGNAQAWLPPVTLADRSLGAAIRVDSTGRTHVLYSPFEAGQGLKYTSSLDGDNWSEAAALPSGLVGDWTGQRVRLAIGPDDVLHVAWNSAALPNAFPEHAVYYQRSTDGGVTWTEPFDPDPLPPEVEANTESGFKNKYADVAVGPDGAVHLTWHQHTGLRWHRMSTDGGKTWGASELAFPDLGPAYNGFVDMAFDSGDNMHIIAARNSIWHRRWQPDGSWLPAQMIDARTPDWHHQRVAVVGGNELFLFYPDINGTGLLWYTHRTLDTPAIEPEALPDRPASVSQTIATNAAITEVTAATQADTTTAAAATAQPLPLAQGTERPSGLPTNLLMALGIAPAVVFVLAVFVVQAITMRRRG